MTDGIVPACLTATPVAITATPSAEQVPPLGASVVVISSVSQSFYIVFGQTGSVPAPSASVGVRVLSAMNYPVIFTLVSGATAFRVLRGGGTDSTISWTYG